MVRTSTTLAAAAVLVLALAGATAGATVPVDRALAVADAETGDRLLTVSVDEGDRVALEYTHSVERTRVYDGYRVDGDRLAMDRMEFESYGWGLPSGADVTRENGTFVYEPEGSLAELYVTPGEIAGHELHVADRTYDLVALSDGRSVRIHLTRRPALAAVRDAGGVASRP